MNYLFFLFLLALSACTSIRQIVSNDLKAFQARANKMGTPNDQNCARILSEHWEKINELFDDDDGAAVALLYRGILANRMARATETQVTQNCGQLAAEFAVMIGRMRR
jgi:hypothetical protein